MKKQAMAAASIKSMDDEDYWSTSSASKIKSRGINVFDDNLDFDDAKKFLKKSNVFNDDEDDDDTINWDGTAGARVDVRGYKVSPNHPPQSQSAHSPVTTRPKAPVGTQSSANVNKPTAESIDDIVRRSKAQSASASDVAKMEAEIKFLRRSLQDSRLNKFDQIPVKETIRRILTGQAYSLEPYRGKEEKLQLLDEALRVHDGNAIIACVLFLRDTSTAAIFHRELLLRPAAVEHYVSHLRQLGDTDRLADLLGMLGRAEDAAMLKYKHAVAMTSQEAKIRGLQTVYRAHFQMDGWLRQEAELIQQQVALLERQLPVEADDLREVKKGNAKFHELPRSSSLLDKSVITTLFYCCLYHYDLPPNCLASPRAIRSAHALTDKQFTWTALAALGRLWRWDDIDKLFLVKGWLGGAKMKPVLPFDRVVFALKAATVPSDVKNKFCSLIDNADLRVDVAQKCGCTRSLLETFMQQRDRQGVVETQARLKGNSQDWFFAEDILRNSTIKWKN